MAIALVRLLERPTIQKSSNTLIRSLILWTTKRRVLTKKGNEVIVLDNLMCSQLFGYDKRSVEYNWNYLAKCGNIKRIKRDVRNKKSQKLSEEKKLLPPIP